MSGSEACLFGCRWPSALLIVFSAFAVTADPLPSCEELGDADATFYGVNGEPKVALWQNTSVDLGETCPGLLPGRFELVVSITARFAFSGSVHDMAARFGAVSATQGLRYWSVTAQRWRPIVSDARALRGPADNLVRPDFSADEVLSGEPLYFLQDDTRSTGKNLYVMKARQISPDELMAASYNVTRIKLFLITVFEAESLSAIHYLRRLAPGEWGYFGVSAARALPATNSERSFVNRAAAFYRYLAGIPSDKEPPMAP